MKPWLDNPEMIVALASAFVALCTAAFTAYQAYLSRRHNHLSVRPHLAQSFTKTDVRADGTVPIRMRIYNNGLGPAIIKSYKVYFDGNFLGDADNNENMRNLSRAIVGIVRREMNIVGKPIWMFDPSEAFENHSHRDLIEITVNQNDGDDERRYFVNLERFDFVIDYETLYGERFNYLSVGMRKQ